MNRYLLFIINLMHLFGDVSQENALQVFKSKKTLKIGQSIKKLPT